MKNNPEGIMKGMSQKNLLLQSKNEELLVLSEKRARAEMDYNIAVATETLKLKNEGMSVTVIPTLVKGTSRVAELKLQLDVSDGVYRACQESLKDVRTAIDCYRSMLSWMKEELQKSGIS